MNKSGLFSIRYFIFLFLLSIFIYSVAVFKVGSIVWGDSLYYYAYTRSMVIDHDIDFKNEAYREDFGFPNKPEISETTGKVINKFSPGSSILWIPAFLWGYFISGILEFIGIINQVDGFGFITQYLVAISTIAFSISGLFFIYKTILLFFEKRVAVLTTSSIYLTTQMFYYTSIDPLNSHSASFMLSSLFLYLSVLFLQTNLLNKPIKLIWKRIFYFGLLGGMIALVRNQDFLIILPMSAYLFFKEKKFSFRKAFVKAFIFGLGALLVISIQFLTTFYLYGQFGSPYIIGGEQLSWFKPNLIRVLFSFGNGLFTFAPILMFALAGLIQAKFSLLGKMNIKNFSLYKNISLIAILSFLLQLYVIASWEREIIGGPYGSRMFIGVLPYFSLGLAFIFEKYKKHSKFGLFAILGLALLFINNLLQTVVMLARF